MFENVCRGGGIVNSGTMNSSGGPIIGRDKIVVTPPMAALNDALYPAIEAVRAVPSEFRGEAEAKLDALSSEVGKGNDATDEVVADLVDRRVELVPDAGQAAVRAFSSPAPEVIIETVTRSALRKIYPYWPMNRARQG